MRYFALTILSISCWLISLKPAEAQPLAPGTKAIVHFKQGNADNNGLLPGTNFGLGIETRASTYICNKPAISASGPVNFCVGGNVTLSTPILADADTTVTTLAGSVSGLANGPAAQAKFGRLGEIICRPNNDLYVADYGNSQIRKISGGIVSTFTGAAGVGYRDGTLATAKFNLPIAICTDAAGNMYVADYSNNKIRKISTDSVVTSIAGSSAGEADGTGAAAKFSNPRAICIDPSGNLVVADYSGHRIRKVTMAGVVTTIAGDTAGFRDGPVATALFHNPTDVDYDAAGNLIVTDMANHRIRKITPAGIVSTIAGAGVAGYANGPALSAKFARPYCNFITAEGNMLIGDLDNHKVRMFSKSGKVSTLTGANTSGAGFANGPGYLSKFNYPFGVCLDTAGNVIVAEYGNYLIRKIAVKFGPEAYIWSNGDSVRSVRTDSSGIYSVKKVIAGCTSVSSDPITVNVGGDLPPTVTVGGPTTFCTGDSVLLTSSAATHNIWSNGDTTQSIYARNLGRYFVRGRFGSCTSLASNYVVVTVYLLPPPTTIFANGNQLVANTPNGVVYQWYKNSTLISGQSEQTLPYLGPGSYTVSYTDGRNCTSLQSEAYIVTGIEDLLSNVPLQIVPNPANSVIQINGLRGVQQVSISNMLGQQVYSNLVQPGTDIDLQHLPAGVYRVKTGNSVLRLVKE